MISIIDIKRWWCRWMGHTPDSDKTHYRRYTKVNVVLKEELYMERYSECSRCGEEVMYWRHVGCWRDKADCMKHNWTKWVDKDET
ncbi:MAG: hypothetical protein GY941_16415 [Planctomycetes bacterium]|nr:hypothetical protein [Planctomycetota bacterium]